MCVCVCVCVCVCGVAILLLLKLKCLRVMISVFGWLSDKGQGKFIILLINNVVYTSVLTLCFVIESVKYEINHGNSYV